MANKQHHRSTRSSRRIRRLAPQFDIDIDLTRAVYLPTELKADVLARLEKRDLKSVRLVSREWSVLATAPLFDRVFFSARARDMEVFKQVTRHPFIGKGVREVVYDASLFMVDMTLDDYFWHLCKSLFCSSIDYESEPFNCANEQINTFVEDYRAGDHSDIYQRDTRTDLYQRHIRDDFILEGHRNHHNYPEIERRGLGNGIVLSRLCGGLRRLDSLRSVRFDSTLWQYCLRENKGYGTVKPNTLHGPESGSPLVRSWNPLHLRPFEWNCEEMENERSLICDHFYTMTAAMTETRRTIKSLEIPPDIREGGGIPPQAWISLAMTDDHLMRGLYAYSGLESLNISIDAGPDVDPSDLEALGALPIVLQQMFGLKKLELHLSRYVDWHPTYPKPVEYYTYQQVFPKIALWPKLTQLSITGLAIGAYDLIALVLGRTRVTDLSLHGIELMHGTWEGLVEWLRLSRVTELCLLGDFKHRGGQIFAPHENISGYSHLATLRACEYYAMYGGRHPCLTPESDPDTTLRWYLDLMPEKELDGLIFGLREKGLEVDEFIPYQRLNALGS